MSLPSARTPSGTSRKARRFEDAQTELSYISEYGTIASTLYAHAEKLLRQEGWALDETSASRQKLITMLHSAMIEAEKRSIARQFPLVGVSLDPGFAQLHSGTFLKPVARTSLKAIIKEFRKDPTRSTVVGKTLVKREAQWRMIQEFFGADTPIAGIDRARVRAFMALLEKLPSNASKHFPKATLTKAVEHDFCSLRHGRNSASAWRSCRRPPTARAAGSPKATSRGLIVFASIVIPA